MISLVVVIVIDLSLKGSKLFVIKPDLSLKTTIVFSNQDYVFSNGKSIEIVPDGTSHIINNSKVDFFIEEIEYGYIVYDHILDAYIETFSSTLVPFRRLSFFGIEDAPIESISVGRGSSGDVRYWLRRVNDSDSK